MNDSNDDLFYILFPVLFFLLLIPWLVVSKKIEEEKQKTSMGYGGSAGHMTPMEIEELGKKHRK